MAPKPHAGSSRSSRESWCSWCPPTSRPSTSPRRQSRGLPPTSPSQRSAPIASKRHGPRRADPSVAERDRPEDTGAFTGGRLDLHTPPDSTEPVTHIGEPRAGAALTDVEAGAVVRYLEQQSALLFPHPDGDRCPIARVLGGVLQRLEAAEVHGRLDLGRVPAY